MSNTSLAGILFSPTRQRLLVALLLHLPQPVYAMQLAKRLGVRPSTLQRDLASFTAAGLLKLSRDGNRYYFQANEECPVLPELRVLLIKMAGAAEAPRSKPVRRIAKAEPTETFDSIASTTDTGGSDIALL